VPVDSDQSEAGLNLTPVAEGFGVRSALRAQAQVLRAQADTLEALASALPDGDGDELLDLSELKRRFHLGRASVLSAVEKGELEASRGSRARILVRCSAVRAWLSARPVITRKATTRGEAATLDEWERAQSLELTRVAEGR
jgi:hypothetical protein